MFKKHKSPKPFNIAQKAMILHICWVQVEFRVHKFSQLILPNWAFRLCSLFLLSPTKANKLNIYSRNPCTAQNGLRFFCWLSMVVFVFMAPKLRIHHMHSPRCLQNRLYTQHQPQQQRYLKYVIIQVMVANGISFFSQCFEGPARQEKMSED